MKPRLLSTLLLSLTLGAPLAFSQVTLPDESAREFTLGGSGTTDQDFDDSAGGLSFSYGKYTSEAVLWSLRQTLNYTNPENDDIGWNGSTRIAMDYHFGRERLRPLVGVNVGYIYGDNVDDSWAAGLEAGVKYYVTGSSFLFGIAEYAWLFNDADDVDDTFDDGRFDWSIGVGFNF